LDHEVRRYGIHVSLIEPGFTRTHLGENSQLASQPLETYASERMRALDAIRESVAKGDDPATVASVVLDALSSGTPRLRYPAGREAKFLSRLRKYAPTKLFDNGLRKQFRLKVA
jgi:NAD(P)-dependent dehydrogenase (short-subunit alcohol dehydrogenase family)